MIFAFPRETKLFGKAIKWNMHLSQETDTSGSVRVPVDIYLDNSCLVRQVLKFLLDMKTLLLKGKANSGTEGNVKHTGGLWLLPVLKKAFIVTVRENK